MKLILLNFLLFTSQIVATYYDSDIDGIEDKFDQCANTPFDVLVDQFGCNENGNAGKLIVKIGTDLGFDSTTQSTSTYNFLLHYEKNNWTMGVSNSNYIGYDDMNISSNETGDIYTHLGYTLNHDTFSSVLGMGMKVATANTSVGTGENDYFISTRFTTREPQNPYRLFGTFLYTYTGDTSTAKYEDIFSYSAGIAYTINDNYYTSLYYENSQSIYEDAENYEALVWSNHYTYNDDYFVELDYIRGLDTYSYTHLFAFKIGVVFE
ncbi:MAG: hypothetical protein U9N11_02625 [Campylobacterota bacterium]|nr:hypothetical protein [Campylobacterota bacterium]